MTHVYETPEGGFVYYSEEPPASLTEGLVAVTEAEAETKRGKAREAAREAAGMAPPERAENAPDPLAGLRAKTSTILQAMQAPTE